eukprot:TRINITY_DN585_c0_g1_i3.p1 TRINITY_DN585_c0_g1~~TRINITY_DN585_c0_g1_i3.p1  ORF type:complete len:1033 (-),score=190.91 TRINITY_DN585_c0_g1_i3:1453-4092(-)
MGTQNQPMGSPVNYHPQSQMGTQMGSQYNNSQTGSQYNTQMGQHNSQMNSTQSMGSQMTQNQPMGSPVNYHPQSQMGSQYDTQMGSRYNNSQMGSQYNTQMGQHSSQMNSSQTIGTQTNLSNSRNTPSNPFSSDTSNSYLNHPTSFVNPVPRNDSSHYPSSPDSQRMQQPKVSSNEPEVNTDNGPIWVPDSSVSRCQLCTTTFSIFLRKHHCRNCGKVICGPCSDFQMRLPEIGYHNPVRVCSKCYTSKVTTVIDPSDSIFPSVTNVIAGALNHSVKGLSKLVPNISLPEISFLTPATKVSESDLEHLQNWGIQFSKKDVLHMKDTFDLYEDIDGDLLPKNLSSMLGILGHCGRDQAINFSDCLYTICRNVPHYADDGRIPFNLIAFYSNILVNGSPVEQRNIALNIITHSISQEPQISYSHLVKMLSIIGVWLVNMGINSSTKSDRIREIIEYLEYQTHLVQNSEQYLNSPVPYVIVHGLCYPSYDFYSLVNSVDPPHQIQVDRYQRACREHKGAPIGPLFGDLNFSVQLMIGIQKSLEGNVNYIKPNFGEMKYFRLPSIPENARLVDKRFRDMKLNPNHHTTDSIESNPDFHYYEFKDYSPSVFKDIRRIYGISDEEYLASLGVEQLLLNSVFLGKFNSFNKIGSHGKSGSVFYYSYDGKFIIKTVDHSEAVALTDILPEYHALLSNEGRSLLCPLVGMHRMATPDKSEEYYLTVMLNIMPLDTNYIDTLYDLKGSTTGRRTAMENRHTGVPLKDLDLEHDFIVSEEDKIEILDSMIRDTEFLQKNEIMDYSLLVGVKQLVPGETPLEAPRGCKMAVSLDGTRAYYFGIIDYLVRFRAFKKLEHTFKSFTQEKDFSVQPPPEYRERFINYFMRKIVS